MALQQLRHEKPAENPVTERAVAAGVFGAFEVEEAAFLKVNEDRVGLAAQQAGGEGLKMGIVPDDEDGFARTGEAEGHRAGVILGAKAGGFVQKRVETKLLVKDLGRLNGA